MPLFCINLLKYYIIAHTKRDLKKLTNPPVGYLLTENVTCETQCPVCLHLSQSRMEPKDIAADCHTTAEY